MKNIIIAVIALLALSVLGWFSVYQMKPPTIQADIGKRVGEALESNSLDWVTFDVDGRDVTLGGTAETPVMAQHAFDTANIYGLNSLSSNIVVGNTAEPENIVEDSVVSEVQAPEVEADSSIQNNAVTDVALQNVTNESIAALPIAMDISKDETGELIFNGTVPNMELKNTIDNHIASSGGDPENAVWQVELSSATPPKNWQPNVLNAISTLQVLQQGEVNLSNDRAIVKGVAANQDASDAAEIYAQEIAGDYTTDMNFAIEEAPQAPGLLGAAEEVTMVGSDQYAAKFCQTEFNALLKQQKIVFDSGSSNLQKASTALLDKIAQVSVRCPNQIVQVHGYTDSRGAAAANWKLSKLRAESVAGYLNQKGIEKDRLSAIGHGEKSPIATNKTETGRAKNRRITLIVKGVKK